MFVFTVGATLILWPSDNTVAMVVQQTGDS
jgi:hypothetical protein